jgi:hypothetical protein
LREQRVLPDFGIARFEKVEVFAHAQSRSDSEFTTVYYRPFRDKRTVATADQASQRLRRR